MLPTGGYAPDEYSNSAVKTYVGPKNAKINFHNKPYTIF